MFKKLFLATIILSSIQAHALIADYQFGDYYGTVGGMGGINISTTNGDEQLSLSCYDKQFIVSYANIDKNGQVTYQVNSVEGLNDLVIYIDKTSYDPSNTDFFNAGIAPANILFDKLKSSKGTEKIIFQSRQSGESKPFSTLGLNEAFDGLTYEDCISW